MTYHLMGSHSDILVTVFSHDGFFFLPFFKVDFNSLKKVGFVVCLLVHLFVCF